MTRQISRSGKIKPQNKGAKIIGLLGFIINDSATFNRVINV